jgi:hypothetical protein
VAKLLNYNRMKTLGKILINKEKILKCEDLLILRGGTNSCYLCICPGGVPVKYEWASSWDDAMEEGRDWCAGGERYYSCTEVCDPGWCGY